MYGDSQLLGARAWAAPLSLRLWRAECAEESIMSRKEHRYQEISQCTK